MGWLSPPITTTMGMTTNTITNMGTSTIITGPC